MGILNRDQLEHTQRQIMKLELALDEMKREEAPRAYEIMSQGLVAQIEHMRREIDEYLGITAPAFSEQEVIKPLIESRHPAGYQDTLSMMPAS